MRTEEIKKIIENAEAYLQYKLSSLQRTNGKFRARYEQRLARRIKRRFDKQKNWLLEEMKALSFFQNKSGVYRIERKDSVDEVNNLLARLPEQANIADDIIKNAKPVYRKAAKDVYQKFKMAEHGISFDVANNNAVDYLAKLRTLHLSDFKGSINYETKKRIKQLLVDAAQSGASYNDTASKIQDLGDAGVFSEARGELIAINQIGQAYGKGNHDLIEEFVARTNAIMQKEWITVNDDRVTEECQANQDMGWIGINEHFSSGDSNAPRLSNPRCRCDTGYREVDTQGNEI